MATANDKRFSVARWQAQGPKLLEPTIDGIGDVINNSEGLILYVGISAVFFPR